ncbi:CRISPR-associated helicase Cas3' [Hansschlegelia beijingensis]
MTKVFLETGVSDEESRSPPPHVLWAKMTAHQWHSLIDHSADVAAVLEAIISQPTIESRLARLSAGKRLDDVTCARLGALAFIHDIGKANRGFQARRDPAAAAIGHIDQVAWLFFGREEASGRLRDRLTAVLGLDRMFGWFQDDGEGLLEAVFAHHGRPWNREHPPPAKDVWEAGPDGDPIARLKPMREALDRWFPMAFSPGPALPREPAFQHAFAGLLMLADWLASNADEAFFPLANGACADRMAFARGRAPQVLKAVGLAVEDMRGAEQRVRASFGQAFSGRSPRPLQDAAAEADGRLVILEAETGAGKTEAALWRFASLFRAGLVDGLYFALPTRVAATQIFDRVKRFRDALFPGGERPPVVLAIPGQLRADEAEGRLLPDFGVQWNEESRSDTLWAAERPKRFLAAQIAVGTIDQALLGAIRVRHAHLRGAALLRHLLVVDEVHASDRYMERLLKTLLDGHLAAGGHALLLSATLGAGMRARLCGVAVPPLVEAEAAAYPALTSVDAEMTPRLSPIQATGAGKRVSVEVARTIDDPEAVAARALEAARAGAKVLVIRNTVGQAVRTQTALEAAAGGDIDLLFTVTSQSGASVVTLHHSRFAEPDRRLLDAAVEAALGRDRQEGGLVVIGTQTLEQSLDIDADLLITDLCPADVLLQRIGRLHRHERLRPGGFGEARTVVLAPAERNLLARGLSAFGLGMGKTGGVYEDLRIIEETWRLLEREPTWTIPTMNRRLVEAATHPDRLAALETELSAADPAWDAHFAKGEGKTFANLFAAKHALLDRSTPFEAFKVGTDERIGTRLGAADRHVAFDPQPVGPFGHPVPSLRLPHHLAVGAEATPSKVVDNDHCVAFLAGEAMFTYDRLGLRRERADGRTP